MPPAYDRTTEKKCRRVRTPQGIRPRRLTRQRDPRHGRVALHLVIRRFRWKTAIAYAGAFPVPELYAAEREKQWGVFLASLCFVASGVKRLAELDVGIHLPTRSEPMI